MNTFFNITLALGIVLLATASIAGVGKITFGNEPQNIMEQASISDGIRIDAAWVK